MNPPPSTQSTIPCSAHGRDSATLIREGATAMEPATEPATEPEANILATAVALSLEVVSSTARALAHVAELYDARRANALHDTLARVLALLSPPALTGKIIVTGIGKSYIIARKMTAMLLSLGLPAHVLHAADALHGDLGAVRAGDAVVVISASGASPELQTMLPHISCPVVLVCNQRGSMAVLEVLLAELPELEEAVFGVKAPVMSSTSLLVMCDAVCMGLAVMAAARDAQGGLVAEVRRRFAKNHPGGAIGVAYASEARTVSAVSAMSEANPVSSVSAVSEASCSNTSPEKTLAPFRENILPVPSPRENTLPESSLRENTLPVSSLQENPLPTSSPRENTLSVLSSLHPERKFGDAAYGASCGSPGSSSTASRASSRLGLAFAGFGMTPAHGSLTDFGWQNFPNSDEELEIRVNKSAPLAYGAAKPHSRIREALDFTNRNDVFDTLVMYDQVRVGDVPVDVALVRELIRASVPDHGAPKPQREALRAPNGGSGAALRALLNLVQASKGANQNISDLLTMIDAL